MRKIVARRKLRLKLQLEARYTCTERVLKPGDVLYIPRGVVHHARTNNDSMALHATLAIEHKGRTVADAIAHSCAQALREPRPQHVALDEPFCQQLQGVLTRAASAPPDGSAAVETAVSPSSRLLLASLVADVRMQLVRPFDAPADTVQAIVAMRVRNTPLGRDLAKALATTSASLAPPWAARDALASVLLSLDVNSVGATAVRTTGRMRHASATRGLLVPVCLCCALRRLDAFSSHTHLALSPAPPPLLLLAVPS